MASIMGRLGRWGMLWARSRDGLSQEEAKKLFFQFRRKTVPRPEEPKERPASPGPDDPDVAREMTRFMRDTTEKLDRIENDINYLKRQVDTILKKI